MRVEFWRVASRGAVRALSIGDWRLGLRSDVVTIWSCRRISHCHHLHNTTTYRAVTQCFCHVRGPDKVLVSDDMSRAVKPAVSVPARGVFSVALCSSPIPMALASCGGTVALFSVQCPDGKSCSVTPTNAPRDENAATLCFDDRVDSRRSIPSREGRVYNWLSTA